MKRILMLPALMLVGMVGSAGAAYAPCTGEQAGYCQYGSGCEQLNKGANDTDDCTTVYTNCKKNGWVFTGTAEPSSLGEGTVCKNITGLSFKESEKTEPPPDVLATQDACCHYTGDNVCWKAASAECTGDGRVSVAMTACSTGNGVCQGLGNNTPEPILQHHGMAKVAGLTLAPHSLGMQISTAKDAKLTMFDARGNTVYRADVVAGLNVVSMKDQKQGVYFAVVTSGSLKQSLKVVVK